MTNRATFTLEDDAIAYLKQAGGDNKSRSVQAGRACPAARGGAPLRAHAARKCRAHPPGRARQGRKKRLAIIAERPMIVRLLFREKLVSVAVSK